MENKELKELNQNIKKVSLLIERLIVLLDGSSSRKEPLRDREKEILKRLLK
ncbi:hypothetical protein [Wolinella succinogenes]|uniref:hypothetical protein n=1 Tax=Wolinella succinogenes TaxID=844 RepID=UPI002FCB0241